MQRTDVASTLPNEKKTRVEISAEEGIRDSAKRTRPTKGDCESESLAMRLHMSEKEK
jgi:hypothetical protein